MRKVKLGYIIFYVVDVIVLFLSYVFVAWYKQPNVATYVVSHHTYFMILSIVWLMTSMINGKIPGKGAHNYTSFTIKVLLTNLITFGVTVAILFGMGETSLSRIMVFGTVVAASLVELFLGSLFFYFKKAQISGWESDEEVISEHLFEYDLVSRLNSGHEENDGILVPLQPRVVESIENEIGKETAEGLINMIGNKLVGDISVLSIVDPFNLQTLPQPVYKYIVNLHIINDIKNIDLFINEVNKKVDIGGYFCCCVETKDQRKKRILNKFPIIVNYIIYFFDFLFMRVFPKLRFTRFLYKLYFRGNNASISRAEALGRVCRGGFAITAERFIGNYLFIEARKKSGPLPIKENMGSLIIALERIGKGGEIIKVYKLRTMYPYSEYIQDYIYEQSNIQPGGKFKDDFRITSWGAFCRKVWLDELPMIINFLKGDLKLVGVRPLSRQYFNLYNIKVQQQRIKFKPGLIPPFYKDMPKDVESIQKSEVKYLDLYEKHPFLTDCNYFFSSFWNIFFRHARSK